MKFGKNLMRVVETSDPEWGPYWMNYKFLKRKINDIVESKGGVKITDQSLARNPEVLSQSSNEVEFFRLLRSELKKASDFFATTEQLYRIRRERIWGAFAMLENDGVQQDKNAWTRLLVACVKFYKDVLLIENFAIMNYCGFSKILKKHDKLTGFVTREAFMQKVMNRQNFTHYPYIMELIRDAELLFANIQRMESVMPLQDEERLFIEAMRDLNHQASLLQAEEKSTLSDSEPELRREPGGSKETAEECVGGSEQAMRSPACAADPPKGDTTGSRRDERLHAAAISAFEAAQRLHRTASAPVSALPSPHKVPTVSVSPPTVPFASLEEDCHHSHANVADSDKVGVDTPSTVDGAADAKLPKLPAPGSKRSASDAGLPN